MTEAGTERWGPSVGRGCWLLSCKGPPTQGQNAPREAVGSHLSSPPPLNLMGDCRHEAQGRPTPEPPSTALCVPPACPSFHPPMSYIHTPSLRYAPLSVSSPNMLPVSLSIPPLVCQSDNLRTLWASPGPPLAASAQLFATRPFPSLNAPPYLGQEHLEGILSEDGRCGRRGRLPQDYLLWAGLRRGRLRLGGRLWSRGLWRRLRLWLLETHRQ